MNIIEVKNNLVKFGYEEDLGLSNLVMIKDSAKSYIAQIIHLESTRTGKTAIGKIVFCYDTQIRAYDGTIPAVKSESILLEPSFLLDLIATEDNVLLGKVLGSNENIAVDFNTLNDNPIIISEKFYITKYLLNNLALQIKARNKKLVVFDTAGMFKANKLSIIQDFKLPLNCDTIDYICDKAFIDATPESRAIIQAIFEELSEYAKTVEFIPFDTFKSVVDSEFARTKMMQLVILKNKLKQLRVMDIFAQTSSELGSIRSQIINNQIVVIDISKINPSLQAETIKYIYSVLEGIDEEIYAITPLSDGDRGVLTKILGTENVNTTIVCDYSYEHLPELKKASKDMLMFTPIKQQKDFGGYNILLQKLAEDEFVAYGKMTKFVPIIGKLYQMTASDIKVPDKYIVEQTAPQAEEVPEVPAEPVETVSEIPQEQPIAEPVVETPNEEPVITEEIPVVDEVEKTQEELLAELEGPEITEPSREISEIIKPQPEDIETPVIVEEEPADDGSVTEDKIAQMATGTVEEVLNNAQENVADAVEPVAEQELPVLEETPQAQTELQQALEEVPEIDDAEELSDDDLDMIEQLSTPNEEIAVLNTEEQEAVVEPQTEPVPETVNEPVQQEAEAPVQEIREEVPQEQEVPAEEEVTAPPQTEPLQTRSSTTPSVPEYSAEIPNEDKVNSDALQQGDKVIHDEFGEGVVEKMINYGDKILCSVNFASVGRRLLNPEISEMRKIG